MENEWKVKIEIQNICDFKSSLEIIFYDLFQ